MQPEQEIIRNYCYICQLVNESKNPLSCLKCGSIDLISIPDDAFISTETKIFKPSIIDKLAKPKIELDENAVKHLLKDDFLFLTGNAGTGKSTIIRELSKTNSTWMKLCSTTGIAAINAGGITINSALKYFDTKSLGAKFDNGFLHMNLRKIRANFKILGIDEISMMDSEQLDYICDAVDEINNDGTGKKLGLHLVGDLAQLPPINAPFVFKSKYWDRFEENTIKLTKIWRQDNQDFLKAINLVRAGKGNDAVIALLDCGVKFVPTLDNNFQGTTIIPKNDGVDHFNNIRLGQIDSPVIRLTPIKRGMQLGEWEKQIPYELRLKVGAYIVILANDPMFRYANGDCGIIERYEPNGELFFVRLKRNNELVRIGRILRENRSDNMPTQNHFSSMFSPYVDNFTGEWVMGTIKYHPIRLAWATTCHKSQGLSLDAVQIDSRHAFFGSDNLAYVAISRCKTASGLVVVGEPRYVAGKIKVSKDVLQYI